MRLPVGALRTRALLAWFVALTSLAILAQTGWAVFQDRRLTVESVRNNALVAARLLEEHANQQLDAAARRLELVASRTAIASDGAEPIEHQIRAIIESSLTNSRSEGALQYVDRNGQRWASMFDFPAFVFLKEPRAYIAYLLAHQQHKGIVVGRPLRRFIDGALVLPLARNLYDRDGHYVGLISTEIELQYFNQVYERVARTGGALAALMANEGFLIVRTGGDIGRDPEPASPWGRIAHAAGNEGALDDVALVDGSPRRFLTTYRKLGAFPLTIVFGIDQEQALANWWERSKDRVTFSAVFIALHLLLTWYLLLHMRRLQESERKLRASETRFVDLFHRAPIPLALMRFDTFTLVEANDAILALFGYEHDEFVGHTPLELHLWAHAEDRAPYLALLERQRFVDRMEVLLRKRNGDVAICQLSTRLIETDGTTLAIFSPNDISQLREAEQEIRTLNAELEERVQQRTAKLQDALATVRQMQGELVRSEKMAALGSLVAGVAHELNTPIGNSVTVASTVADHAQELRGELAQDRPRRSRLEEMAGAIGGGVDILMRNLERVAALVTSFKQVAVDQSSDQRRGFDLKVTVDEIMLALAPMCRKYKVRVDC
ncbi:MAG TPA: PAS domain S-box protein, partial [Telluria sp.]|nr:PAS domain S-box protein [Telluria sp.]